MMSFCWNRLSWMAVMIVILGGVLLTSASNAVSAGVGGDSSLEEDIGVIYLIESEHIVINDISYKVQSATKYLTAKNTPGTIAMLKIGMEVLFMYRLPENELIEVKVSGTEDGVASPLEEIGGTASGEESTQPDANSGQGSSGDVELKDGVWTN